MFVSVFKDLRDSVPDDSGFRILLHRLHNAAELFRRPPIVAVQEGDNFPLALGIPALNAEAWPPFGFANQAHARLKSANDFRRAVRRTIVHDEDFNVVHRHVLFEDAGDGALNEALVIVRVD